MNLKKRLFSLMFMTFFLAGVAGFAQSNKATMLDELSYTEDQTWFNQKKGWSEVTQSQQRQPWRQATWEERVHHFITALRKGDRKAFLFVEYPLLDGYFSSQGYPIEPSIAGERVGGGEGGGERGNGKTASLGVIWKIYFEAKRSNTTAMKWLDNGDPKVHANVVRATLSGLFNKDPRVRLVAVNFLRRLRPDASMASDVKRALVLETATSERAKWRDKDIDIPSIEQPRLGYGAVAWRSGAGAPYELKARFTDGLDNGIKDLLDGNGKGTYLVEGLYRKTERNDYPTEVTDVNHATGLTTKRTVWTKASLLRYGADEHASGFEAEYGYKKAKEYMPKYIYTYIDYRDPGSERLVESAYTAYHSVWEEMKKLDLFITRVVWTDKVKQGDVNTLRWISKDTFRTLADQIDGESLEYVPFKSPSFKIFSEPEVRAIIVGMLENRVVSTREECVRFLKRIFDQTSTSVATKREIKKSLREARRRELIIDVIRGRHLHSELVVPRQADDWWGERDEIDTSANAFGDAERGVRLEQYRNQVQFPEESDIIFHDRRKPGASGDAAPKAETKAKSADILEKSDARISHPLLASSKVTYQDVESYFQLDEFLGKKAPVTTTTKPDVEEPKVDDWGFVDNADVISGDRLRPGQSPGVRTVPIPNDSMKRSVTARYYERIRAVEVLHSLLLGDGDALLRASYVDVQNSLLLYMALIHRDRPNPKDVIEDDFLWYLLAGASAVSGNEGTRFHSHKELDLELGRGERTVANIMKLWNGAKANLKVARLEQGKLAEDEKMLADFRNFYYDDLQRTPGAGSLDAGRTPGKSADQGLAGRGTSHRDLSEKRFGKFYGHGRGGYYKSYDQEYKLPQAENDAVKKALSFYQFPTIWNGTRKQIVNGLLVGLGDKDPQKRLVFIHLLRRLIPDASMLPRVNKLLRELETVDRRPYKYLDTVTYDPANPGNATIRRQEKIVGHELLKLQRFIVRRILVNKIKSGSEPAFLKEIPKGSFLTLVVRIDAEWDPFRIPLRTPIPRDTKGTNGMFFTKSDIDVIKGGLENRNFLVQRETARWIVSFYNRNRASGDIKDPSSDDSASKFLNAVKFAEARDIVYYERNYVNWKYKDNAFNATVPETGNTGDPANTIRVQKGENVVGVPVGRVAVRIGTWTDSDIFRAIDNDRKIEYFDHYGRSRDAGAKDLDNFEELKATGTDYSENVGDVRKAYRDLREARDAEKSLLGEKTVGKEDAKTAPDLDFRGQ
jgi:hypothetical protein